MSIIQSNTADAGLDSNQVLKASLALIQRMEKLQDAHRIDKPSLLVDDDEENQNSQLDVPLWLTVTAKSHIATSHSLKPGKVIVPHVLYSMPNTRVCLITADPPADNPSAYKNIVADKLFPKDIRRMISKIISFSKVLKKYKSYESRRQFLADFDVFLADERILKLLPSALGKVFYKSRTKRPIPVSLTGKENWGQKTKKTALDRLKAKPKGSATNGPETMGQPADVAGDIEKALSIVPVHLSPSASTAIKVAYAGWPAEWISANVEAVVNRVVEKWIPGGWAGVKSIHLKGPETASLPIFMAREDWVTEDDVLDIGEPDTELNFQKKSKEEKREKKKQKKIAQKKAAEDIEIESVDDALPVKPVEPSKKRKRAKEAEDQEQATELPVPEESEPAIEKPKAKKEKQTTEKAAKKKRKVSEIAEASEVVEVPVQEVEETELQQEEAKQPKKKGKAKSKKKQK